MAQQKSGGKRIALFGLFGLGSYGNDGTLEAVVDFFRTAAPKESLVCICTDPDVVRNNLGVDATVIAHGSRPSKSSRAVTRLKKAIGKSLILFHAAWQLRSIKKLILPGGGGLSDFQAHPLGWPFDFMVWTVLARLMGVKVVLASVGAGPMKNPVSRLFLTMAARAAHSLSYREDTSRQFMASIGFDVSRDHIYPDIAFRLPAPPDASTGEPPLTIGVGLMTYYGWQEGPERIRGLHQAYVDKITAYVEWLVEQGYRIRIVIGDQSDERALRDVLNAVHDKHPAWIGETIVYEPATTLTAIMQQLAHVDLVVATRFHNVVCALKMRKPTISISYHAKNDLLLSEMGLGEFSQHIERIDVDRLKYQTLQMIADRVAVGQRIGEVCARFEAELGELETTLLSLLHDAGALRSQTRAVPSPQ